MKRLFQTLVLLAALPALAAGPGDPVPAFEARVARGGKTALHDSRAAKRPTLYLFVGARCPTTGKYLPRVRALEEKHAGKVDFLYLYPNATDSPAEKAAFHEQSKLAGGMIDDAGARLAALLGAQRTAEAFLVDAGGRIAYRGAIDDDREGKAVTRAHLDLAIGEVLAGKPVSTPTTRVHA
jgi:peroxiredoxin